MSPSRPLSFALICAFSAIGGMSAELVGSYVAQYLYTSTTVHITAVNQGTDFYCARTTTVFPYITGSLSTLYATNYGNAESKLQG
jgi:hypothetical protein